MPALGINSAENSTQKEDGSPGNAGRKEEEKQEGKLHG